MRVQFSPLTKQHDRASFDCGDEEMNGFVRHFLAQQVKAGETSCYVLEDADTYEIIGLFTLNPSSVPREQIPWSEKFAYPMVSVYLLGRLAVSAKHQGMGYGKLMILSFAAFYTRNSFR